MLIPLALFRKGPLVNLDVRDEDGRPVPVLTRSENAEIAASLLQSALDASLSDGQPRIDLQDSLRVLAAVDAKSAIAVQKEIRSQISRSSLADARILDLIKEFQDNFLLIGLIETRPGDRRIIKFAYDQAISIGSGTNRDLGRILFAAAPAPRRRGVLGWARRLLRRLPMSVQGLLEQVGLLATPIAFEVPAVAECRSYHFEAVAPPGLRFSGARMAVRALRNSDLVEESAYTSASGNRDRVHLYVSEVDVVNGSRGVAGLFLRAQRHGWLRAGLFVSLLSLGVVLSIALYGVDDVRATQSATRLAASALLIALPGIYAAMLLRNGEHPLLTRALRGARGLVVTSALVVYLTAGVVVLADEYAWVLGILVFVAAVAGILLAIVYSRSMPDR